MIDLDVIDAATGPEVPWRPWMVAALLGVRVVRAPLVDGVLGVSLYEPATVYLAAGMAAVQEDYVLTRQLLFLCRDGWPEDLVTAEAAFLLSAASAA